MIADDDRLVRFTIKSMLMEILESDQHLYMEAANGRDMQQICRNERPDIVFADIQMPYLNGLEAIDACRRELPKTEFVIISGFSEFGYAQKAIQLGIHDYLLKPVSEEKLREVVETLLRKLAQKKQESNSVFHMKMLNVFNYYAIPDMGEMVEEFCYPSGWGYLGFGLVMGGRHGKQREAMRQQKVLFDRVRALGEEIVGQKGYFSMVYSPEGMPCFIFCCERKLQDRVRSAMDRICRTESGKSDFFCMFRFAGTTGKEIFQVCEALDISHYLAMNYPGGTVVDWEETGLRAEDIQVLEMTERLLEAWENADEVRYKEVLNDMYRINRNKQLDLNLKNVASYCSYITGQPVTPDNFKEFCRSFIDMASGMYGSLQAEESDMIQRVKDYIQKNYMKDISISQIAEQFDLTANYLSTVFHNKAGCKFVEYLTDVRVSNAKRLLLQNTSASVKDIALLVGYNSARHFSALFQKQTGMTPTVYRKAGGEKNSKKKVPEL